MCNIVKFSLSSSHPFIYTIDGDRKCITFPYAFNKIVRRPTGMASFINNIIIENPDLRHIKRSEKESLGWDGWVNLVCRVIVTIFTVADYFGSRLGQPLINVTINLFNKH